MKGIENRRGSSGTGMGLETEVRQQAPAGTTQVVVEVRNPSAKHVVITGDFSGWSPSRFPLRKDPDGVWRTKLHLRPGEYQYRLRVDGEWRDDPHAVKQAPNPFGGQNAVMVVPEIKETAGQGA